MQAVGDLSLGRTFWTLNASPPLPHSRTFSVLKLYHPENALVPASTWQRQRCEIRQYSTRNPITWYWNVWVLPRTSDYIIQKQGSCYLQSQCVCKGFEKLLLPRSCINYCRTAFLSLFGHKRELWWWQVWTSQLSCVFLSCSGTPGMHLWGDHDLFCFGHSTRFPLYYKVIVVKIICTYLVLTHLCFRFSYGHC